MKMAVRYIFLMELAAKLQLKPNQSLKGVGTPHAVESELAELDHVGDAQEAALLFFITDRAALEVHREQIVDAASRDHLTCRVPEKPVTSARTSTVTRWPLLLERKRRATSPSNRPSNEVWSPCDSDQDHDEQVRRTVTVPKPRRFVRGPSPEHA